MGTRKNVQRFSRSAIQLFNPKKRTYDIHRPNSSDITQGQRTLVKNYDSRIYVQNFWETAIQLFNQKKRVYNISVP